SEEDAAAHHQDHAPNRPEHRVLHLPPEIIEIPNVQCANHKIGQEEQETGRRNDHPGVIKHFPQVRYLPRHAHPPSGSVFHTATLYPLDRELFEQTPSKRPLPPLRFALLPIELIHFFIEVHAAIFISSFASTIEAMRIAAWRSCMSPFLRSPSCARLQILTPLVVVCRARAIRG